MSAVAPTGLPPLLHGERRPMMVALALVAVTIVTCALVSAVLVGRLLGPAAGPGTVLGLMFSAVVLAAATHAERVLGERLGQSYVHELRRLLLAAALRDPRRTSLGVTVARTTNDLSAMRTWLAQGLVPAMTLGVLVVGCCAGLAVLHPLLAGSAAAVLTGVGVAAVPLSRRAYTAARQLRRERGRLAALVADTVRARDGIMAAGGERRELERVARRSDRVVQAAHRRARTAGMLRGTAAAGAALLTVAVVLTARATAAPGELTQMIASSLVLTGVLAGPISSLGRIAELLQNNRAARHVLQPVLIGVDEPPWPQRPPLPPRLMGGPPGEIVVTCRAHGRAARPMRWSAVAGERIHLVGADRQELGAHLADLATPRRDGPHVRVDGWDLAAVGPRRRRELVGLAAADTVLERGTIERVLGYRRPELPRGPMLQRVGLDEVVAGLARQERTELRDGAPLRRAHRGLLILGRAIAGDPPLLMVDHLDELLDPDGMLVLRAVVAGYPGVVVLASRDAQLVGSDWRTITV